MSAVWTSMRSRTSATLKRLPPWSGSSASSTETSAPTSTRRRTRLLPIKPRPPVTSAVRPLYSPKCLGSFMSFEGETGSSVAASQQPRRRARLQPQPEKVERRAPDAPQGEKLRAPVRARVMVDGRFDKDAARAVQLVHQLHADAATRREEFEPLDGPPPEQAEVAVHVADWDVE